MGIPVLIIGKSGAGKSTSLRNFKKDEIGLVNVSKKPLPFKGKFDGELKSDDYQVIVTAITKTDKKTVVIDDASYLLVNHFMKGHSKAGSGNAIFGFYNNVGDSFWQLIETIKMLPDDKVVYVLMHEEKNEYGDIKPKTIGKILDDKVCLEGMFTIVLRATKEGDKHIFKTKTDGLDVTKTPMGMFETAIIDNDLKLVDKAIREYYLLDEKLDEK